jgi:ribose-phosphate pyrophosphokinase
MHNLNLTPLFNPFASKESEELQFETFNFSAGEVHIKITPPARPLTHVNLSTRLNTSNCILRLLLAHNALLNLGAQSIYLHIPYLPYARQDRLVQPGEPLSIKVIAQLLNALPNTKISAYDVHSDVTTALLNNFTNYSNHSFVTKVLATLSPNITLVATDAGAYKKIFALAQNLKLTNPIISCTKARDAATGQIKNLDICSPSLQGSPCLIIDDICDGGTTFIQVAQALQNKNAGAIYLAVSHGIFSKGIQVLQPYVQHIYTTNSYTQHTSPLVTQYNIAELL